MNLTLTTERLTLSPLTPNDVDLVIEMFTDPQVLKYAGGVMSEVVIRNGMADWSKRGSNGCIGIWCISDTQSGEKFGTVALLPMPVDEDDTDFSLVVPGEMPEAEIEVGYFLKRTAWGCGYATEACRGVIRLAFEHGELDAVVATFDAGNDASKNVLTKSGFRDCGTMRCYGEDGFRYRITRQEWLEQ